MVTTFIQLTVKREEKEVYHLCALQTRGIITSRLSGLLLVPVSTLSGGRWCLPVVCLLTGFEVRRVNKAHIMIYMAQCAYYIDLCAFGTRQTCQRAA